MSKQSHSSRTRSRHRRSSAAYAPVNSNLAALECRFAEFRASSSQSAHVPEELRSGVLNEVDAGAPLATVRRLCGVTRAQIAVWQSNRRRRSGGLRAFTVVDDAAVSRKAAEEQAEQALELRLGPWSVSVRLTEQPTGGRG